MTLGMPREASGRSAVLAISSASLALGSSALVIAAALVVLRNVNSPYDVWLALLFLVPIGALMVLRHFQHSLFVAVAYLLIAAVCIGFYSSILLSNAPEAIVESPFILALPQIAVVYTVAPRLLGVQSLVLICSAYVVGQLAVTAAALEAGRFPAFDFMTAASTIVVVVICAADLLLRRRTEVDQRAVARARRDADAMNYQQELESQVVALFHDTVLSELTVLSHQTPGPLGESQREAIQRDLALIAEGSWWPDETAVPGAAPRDGGLPAELAAVVAASRAEGLTVDVSGDIASLHRFTPAVASALALAVRQALVNVRQHSGVDRAEVVVDGEADAVVVMIADAGVGFDPAAVPTDRFGVSQSIRGRIRDVGGQTQLWTAPGDGTAFMFTLPVAPEHAWEPR
ncbi:sensor histidine kinase [Herbiconiux sp. UC225_62]|uniref:sensor histidine kinase n=1 Tax=Herbiconiux sp. UC225_62 TaxID=3350168 RepID=UPI0036D20AA0